MPHLTRRQGRWAVMVLLLWVCSPVSASAQNGACTKAEACTIGVSTSSATTIVGIGVTMLTRIKSRKIAALDLYARQNQVAILAAVSLGAGDVLIDLAALAMVREEDLPNFAQRLRAHRAAFVQTASPGYLGALVLQIAEE